MGEEAKSGSCENWNIDCSDDEKYEVKSKWVTIGVRECDGIVGIWKGFTECFYKL